MNYDFDIVQERQDTASKKWDAVQSHFGTEKDILPMWVADMDFRSPNPVMEALKERAEQGIYGYTIQTDSYLNSIVHWFSRRHGWLIEKEWISHSPGIIPALSLIIHAFTEPDDKVIVQSPVHHAFYRVLRLQERQILENQLHVENGYYTMDFEDLEKKLRDGAKMLILCSPHNPVGRVWNKEELTKLGELCSKYNALVVSDEVWCDIVYEPNKHIPYASISSEFANHSITCVSPSKSFNLMGLKTSAIVIPNNMMREKFESALNTFSLAAPSYFGVTALEAAYNHGEEWLDQLLEYLKGNVQYISEFLIKYMPNVRMTQPEGTYLGWLDFREFRLDDEQLKKIIVEKANVGFDEGPVFGTGGEGFIRLNFACPRSMIEKGLQQIYNAFLKSSVVTNF